MGKQIIRIIINLIIIIIIKWLKNSIILNEKQIKSTLTIENKTIIQETIILQILKNLTNY